MVNLVCSKNNLFLKKEFSLYSLVKKKQKQPSLITLTELEYFGTG